MTYKQKIYNLFSVKIEKTRRAETLRAIPAIAVSRPIMTCTNGRWVAAPCFSCSQRPPYVKAQAGGLQSNQEN